MSWLRELVFSGNNSGMNENVVENTGDMLDVFVWVLPILGILYLVRQYDGWKSNKEYREKLLSDPENLKILKDCGWKDSKQ